jgi:hypothetical protein
MRTTRFGAAVVALCVVVSACTPRPAFQGIRRRDTTTPVTSTPHEEDSLVRVGWDLLRHSGPLVTIQVTEGACSSYNGVRVTQTSRRVSIAVYNVSRRHHDPVIGCLLNAIVSPKTIVLLEPLGHATLVGCVPSKPLQVCKEPHR